MIEDTIKRNASPIREASQEGSCSSLASSDDQLVASRGTVRTVNVGQHPILVHSQLPLGNKLTRSTSHHNANYLVHSTSSNDASLGEYKYTVNVGHHSIKITGDSLELVRVAKLVLDDFFTGEEFLKSSEAHSLYTSEMIPVAHQLNQHTSPFVDSGVHLNDLLTRSPSGANAQMPHQNPSNDIDDDDVFAQEREPVIGDHTSQSSIEESSSSSSNTIQNSPSTPSNGLSRSRRSHFSRKESTPEMVKPKSEREFSSHLYAVII